MKKNYQQHMETREWIALALLDLMREYPYETITITQITARAGVPRMTYYRNYSAKEEILADYIEYLSQILAYRYRTLSHVDGRTYLELLFNFVGEYADVMNILIANNKENLFQKVVFKNIEKLHLSGEMLWAVQYYAGGTLSLILEWIKNPTEGYKQELINGILKMTRKSVLDEAVKSYQKNLDQIK